MAMPPRVDPPGPAMQRHAGRMQYDGGGQRAHLMGLPAVYELQQTLYLSLLSFSLFAPDLIPPSFDRF